MSTLPAFAEMLAREDSRIDLAHACLMIAQDAYPELEVEPYLGEIERMALRLRARLPQSCGMEERVVGLNQFLFHDLGFGGNTDEYYDPRNSYLNDVIDRRTGIPISLSVLYMAVGRRVGLPLEGVSFPGHFLVRTVKRGGASAFIDPFEGRVLEPGQLRSLYEQATGDPSSGIDERYLEPAPRRQIIARMLNNLRAIYEVRGDRQRLRRVLERLAVVSPSDEVRSRLDHLVQTAALAPRVSVN